MEARHVLRVSAQPMQGKKQGPCSSSTVDPGACGVRGAGEQEQSPDLLAHATPGCLGARGELTGLCGKFGV